MLETLSYPFVWLAILCSMILAGIHAYLGFHIVSRGVIFVDLALAQIAALGVVVATLFGFDEGSPWRYVISLGFTFTGAGIVSVARIRDERIPQEAFIGILYAAGAALTILCLSRVAGGMDELQHLLAGSILTVQPREIMAIAVVYAVIAGIHYTFRNRFFTITRNYDEACSKGWKVGGWDFLFYSTFAIVVTTAVSIAGVLLVFSLLVVPPVIALFYARSEGPRLLLGWIVALAGSILGVMVSIRFDLPAGPSIIAVLVALLIVVATIHRIRREPVGTPP
jgi:zinc/manganese transport system permease protein